MWNYVLNLDNVYQDDQLYYRAYKTLRESQRNTDYNSPANSTNRSKKIEIKRHTHNNMTQIHAYHNLS